MSRRHIECPACLVYAAEHGITYVEVPRVVHLEHRVCLACGKPLKDKARIDALYCNNVCRARSNNLMRIREPVC